MQSAPLAVSRKARVACSELCIFCSHCAIHLLQVTHRLGGKNFVFWGGREGYHTLLNTDMKQELDHLAGFFKQAVQHKQNIGFQGTFLLEPKPQEPTKHQVPDCAAVKWACCTFPHQYITFLKSEYIYRELRRVSMTFSHA